MCTEKVCGTLTRPRTIFSIQMGRPLSRELRFAAPSRGRCFKPKQEKFYHFTQPRCKKAPADLHFSVKNLQTSCLVSKFSSPYRARPRGGTGAICRIVSHREKWNTDGIFSVPEQWSSLCDVKPTGRSAGSRRKHVTQRN